MASEPDGVDVVRIAAMASALSTTTDAASRTDCHASAQRIGAPKKKKRISIDLSEEYT